jgi:gliding motility-associated lipoprotein GldH
MPKKMRKKYNILVLILLLVITGCKFNSVFEKSFDIQKSEWHKNQIVQFDIPVTDTISGHNIYIIVRNTNDYSYSNLFLFVSTQSPNGPVIKDTLETTLADEKGKWLGRGLGGVLSNDIPFKKNVRFPVAGIYKIAIVQAMRDDVLKGITDVGIKVEKVK